MLRIFFTLVLIAAVRSEYDVSEVLGKWLPAVIYPPGVSIKYCRWFDISLDNQLTCTCGERGETPVLKVAHPDPGAKKGTKSFPTIFINETEQVAPNLNYGCTCNGHNQPQIIIRKVNENYFAMYVPRPDMNSATEKAYSSSLFIKNVPKLSELQAVWRSVFDLRDKEPWYMCDTSFFAREDS